jgi:hypothetical protein
MLPTDLDYDQRHKLYNNIRSSQTCFVRLYLLFLFAHVAIASRLDVLQHLHEQHRPMSYRTPAEATRTMQAS